MTYAEGLAVSLSKVNHHRDEICIGLTFHGSHLSLLDKFFKVHGVKNQKGMSGYLDT